MTQPGTQSSETRNPADALSPREALALLALQLEWGADEAIQATPVDRLARTAASVGATRTAAPPAAAAARTGPGGSNTGAAQAAERLAAASGTIAALRDAVERFDGCALRETAGHTVLASGEPGSGLLLVGEVPDADEDRTGVAFSGKTGDLLDRMLGSIALSRADLLIAPLVPWRPPGDRRVNPIELAACLPFLYRLIALAQPRYLILMGIRPTRAFFGADATLARLRGRTHAIALPGMQSTPATLPMRHPSQLFGNSMARRDAWADLLLLRQCLDAD